MPSLSTIETTCGEEIEKTHKVILRHCGINETFRTKDNEHRNVKQHGYFQGGIADKFTPEACTPTTNSYIAL